MSANSKPKDQVAFPDPSVYLLNRQNSRKAIEAGLAEAEWYQSPIPPAKMRKLLVRRNGPALRDAFIWFGLIFASAAATISLWGTWWVIAPYLIYAALFAGSADARWHEGLHGTAFKTDWLNIALYEIASFMVLRESTVWRWSHTRHHSDTIIVGRDPEIAVPRPPDITGMLLGCFAIKRYPKYFGNLLHHARGQLAERERAFIPEDEFPKVFRTARVHLAVYLLVIAGALIAGSFLPLFLICLPNIFGTWLMSLYGLTQHTGLAENVLDHRLNSRTFLTNIVNRFLYLNMNYHVEHHMFPLVPYYNLPALHEIVKDDCPAPYPSLWACWKEIIPTVARQTEEPGYHIQRSLPSTGGREKKPAITPSCPANAEGWLEICPSAALENSEVIRVDHHDQTYAIYRDGEGQLYATDGICTHGKTHLADGLVMKKMIECPKHNGRFNLADGSPARRPACKALQTHQVREVSGRIQFHPS